MFGFSPNRFTMFATVSAFVAVISTPFAGADVIFSDNFESQTVGNQPAWTSVSDNNNVADPTVKFRVANSGDPFATGVADQNKYLLTRDTQNSAGGNATVRDLANAANVATLSFDVVEPTRAGTGTRLYINVGQTTGTLGTDAERAFQFHLNDGDFYTSNNGIHAFYTLDAKHTVSIVMNYSASAINYAGPGGASESLASGKYDLYIDGVKALNDAARYTNGAATTLAIGTPLSAFNIQSFGGDANQEILVDNVVFQTGAVIPEPATMGLMGLGLGALALRRR